MVDRLIYRGMLRVIVLKSLSEQPLHGYALMNKVEESYGFKPSPGAIYPLLRRMILEGLVTVEERRVGDRVVKVYSVTDKGVSYLREHASLVTLLDQLSAKLKIAGDIGLLALAKNFFWLFRHINEIPSDKLNEFKPKFSEVNEMISRLKRVEAWR
ncbi:PadR family transcriptional regulator [Thermogladius sp.]|uniref:PadR family transcriptional regulator n=1 Tax=Thermogladius sp. TaxID=2023064 RepID=UPI003D10BDF0